jgi:hypothetical protein
MEGDKTVYDYNGISTPFTNHGIKIFREADGAVRKVLQ